MEITTKFNINDIVRHKFGYGYNRAFAEKGTVRYEVLFMRADACSAGAQVFYMLRPIEVVFTKRGYGKDEGTSVDIKVLDMVEVQKVMFREDELEPCEDEMLAWIKNGGGAIPAAEPEQA